MSSRAEIVIEYTPRPPQGEIHRALESHRFTVLVAHRRLGKTVLAVNHLIKMGMLCRRRRPVLAYVAPFRSQAKQIAWDYIKHYTRSLPGRGVNESELALTLPNGAEIRLFGADNPDALRGLYLDGVVLDEVAQMRPETWGEIIRPALSDRHGWAVFIGTPKGQNIFLELYRQAQAQQAAGNPDWCALCYRVDQTNVVPAAELAALQAEMGEGAYRQEYLCDFTAASANVFIPLELALAAKGRNLTEEQYRHAPKTMALDVARFGDDASVLTRRQGLYCMPQRVLRNLDTMTLAGIVAQEWHDWRPDALFVDGVGVGAGVVDRLRQLGVDVIDAQAGARALNPSKYVNRRAEMWAAMREWLHSGAIPPDEQLITDLTGLEFFFAPSGAIQLERKEDLKKRGLCSPDRADSLALTFFSPVLAAGDAEILQALVPEATPYDPLAW